MQPYTYGDMYGDAYGGDYGGGGGGVAYGGAPGVGGGGGRSSNKRHPQPPVTVPIHGQPGDDSFSNLGECTDINFENLDDDPNGPLDE